MPVTMVPLVVDCWRPSTIAGNSAGLPSQVSLDQGKRLPDALVSQIYTCGQIYAAGCAYTALRALLFVQKRLMIAGDSTSPCTTLCSGAGLDEELAMPRDGRNQKKHR